MLPQKLSDFPTQSRYFRGPLGWGSPAAEPLPWQPQCLETGLGRPGDKAEQLLELPGSCPGQDRLWGSLGVSLCFFFPTKIGKGTGPPSPTKDRKKDVSSPQRGQSSPHRRNSRSERR